MLTAIKLYALCSLLFSAGKRRKRIVISVRCGEVVELSDPLPIIKAEPTIWS